MLEVAARLVLGGILAGASLAKLASPASRRAALASFGIAGLLFLAHAQVPVPEVAFLSYWLARVNLVLAIFNLLNVLGFMIGIFLPIIGIFVARIELPAKAWIVTFSPAMISMFASASDESHGENGTRCR